MHALLWSDSVHAACAQLTVPLAPLHLCIPFCFTAPEACSVTQNGHAESDPAAEPPLVKRGLYFVRVPRPVQQFDDAHVKKLQAESQELVTKLRGFNQKLQAKRVRLLHVHIANAA